MNKIRDICVEKTGLSLTSTKTSRLRNIRFSPSVKIWPHTKYTIGIQL